MTDIKSLPLLSLQDALASDEKPYRARQIYEWLHKHLVESFSEMTNLSRATRTYLVENFELPVFTLEKMQESAFDGTRKYLFALADGNLIESVLMKYKHGNSVCISSQAGCRMGCTFCASAIGGLNRSLTAGEMLEQIYAITRNTNERVSNVVVMGIGEPLDNYDELLNFIKILSDYNGLNLSQRNITVSTCGLSPEIYRLADEMLQINLAISLHATTDEKRLKLMPVTKAYPLDELMKACKYYFKKTGRRITFEYSLINNINDSKEDAMELKDLILRFRKQERLLPCHINLIPLNPVKEHDFCASPAKNVLDFKNILEKYQINVTIRREMGSDIDGACGQLRRTNA
ncbi:MAG: 23S rRNA (adenine(2503)-C(2))-methyltransferase RlmN [Lachnospiraceae bacterium]|nr:23S rRNA (adenine(2503)-C(2))-methyltransferase RlmN [Lachnospiraceae bacterium]